MGIVTATLIFQKISALVVTNGYTTTDIDINIGYKLMLFGILYGSIDYLAGLALSVSNSTILKMVGFTAQGGTTNTTTQTISQSQVSGTTTT